MTTIIGLASAAAVAAGCAPDQDASGPDGTAAAPWFEEVAAASGIDFAHDSGHRGTYLFPEIVAGGLALLDHDGDGDLDVYLVQSGSITGDGPGNRLYRNDGDWTFTDVTETSGADDRGYGMGVATGDYDNDGDVDLYVTNCGPNTLLRNRGDGTFEDVTDASGAGDAAWGTGAAFLDYDRDGDLDIFITNYVHWALEREIVCRTPAGRLDYCSPNRYAPAPDVLLRNEGDGTFTDVSSEARMPTAFGNGLGVVCGDFDDDGWIDVFVANDQTMNQLWRNLGDGTFRDEAVIRGCAVDQHGQPKAGMGTTADDIDNDGDLDLLVVNLRTEADSFFRNEGTHFVDDTGLVGLGSASRPFTRFGMAWHDFDNDGWLDLYEVAGRVRGPQELEAQSDDPYAEPNLLLRGRPDATFERHGTTDGTASTLVATSRGAAFGDVDGDGGVDIVIVNKDGPTHALRNTAPDRGNWIMFRVENGHGADAIGATVRLGVGARTLRREVRTAYSYCAANDPRVHVGLGTETRVTDVRVRWPDGTTESFGGFDAGRVVTLRRGAGAAAASG
jgi:hypothetical protein